MNPLTIAGVRIVETPDVPVMKNVLRPSRTKVGPRRRRLQQIVVFSHWSNTVPDGEVVEVANAYYMNPRTLHALRREMGRGEGAG